MKWRLYAEQECITTCIYFSQWTAYINCTLHIFYKNLIYFIYISLLYYTTVLVLNLIPICSTFALPQTTLTVTSNITGYLGTTATAALANCSLKCIKVQKCQALFLPLCPPLPTLPAASGSRWSQLLMHTRILVASRFTAKFSYSFWPIYSLCLQDDNVSYSLRAASSTSLPCLYELPDCWLLFRLVDHRRSQRGLASNCEQSPFWSNELGGAQRAILENGKPKPSVKCGSILSWPDKWPGLAPGQVDQLAERSETLE